MDMMTIILLNGVGVISWLYMIYFALKQQKENKAIDAENSRLSRRLQKTIEELEELKKEAPNRTLTVDAEKLLSDLTSGTAVVKIIPLDAANLFYRSPGK